MCSDELKPININGVIYNQYFVNRKGEVYNTKNKKLKQRLHNRYMYADLFLNGNNKSVAVHRIMACTFLPEKDKKEQVNHINGDRLDNRAENLEWVSRQENIKHAVINGLRANTNGDKNPSSRYSNEQIREACELLFDNHKKLSRAEISKLTGVSKSTLTSIKCGYSWHEISKDYGVKNTRKSNDRYTRLDYTEDQIELACKLISEGIYTRSYISKVTGLSKQMITDLKTGRVWKSIASKYGIEYTRKYKLVKDDDTIIRKTPYRDIFISLYEKGMDVDDIEKCCVNCGHTKEAFRRMIKASKKFANKDKIDKAKNKEELKFNDYRKGGPLSITLG